MEPYIVQVTGKDYEWSFLYPGLDGVLFTADDISSNRRLKIPSNTKIELHLKSEDFIYFLSIPEFKQIGMARNGETNIISFSTNKLGTFGIEGNQMCSFTHENLFAEISVYHPIYFSLALKFRSYF